MRRKEFEVAERAQLVEALERAEWGTLGLVDAASRPVLVPLNHVYLGGRLYFHGSPAGEKMTVLRLNDRASFLVVGTLSRIPSYFTDRAKACAATQFFRSVIAKGRLRVVEDLAEKAAALGALMKKLQPEEGYEPIQPGSSLYDATLGGIAILALEIEEMTGKFKLGQNFSAERRNLVAQGLRDRGTAIDHRTLDTMRVHPDREVDARARVSGFSFSEIAAKYERDSRVQKPASEILFDLLGIGPRDDVLDLGCGTGQITRRIRELTRGKVVGVDASPGMIREALGRNEGLDIRFEVARAEGLQYREAFDVMLCNSAFQWFKEPEPALRACHRALRSGGRMGIQAPASRVYCPNFILAIERLAHDPRTRETFAAFNNPWFFLETADEYTSLFERAGFRVAFSRLDPLRTLHPPEEVLRIFESGAAAGYLNQDCYSTPIDGAFVENAREVISGVFRDQANEAGMVELVFNRVYLVAVKE